MSQVLVVAQTVQSLIAGLGDDGLESASYHSRSSQVVLMDHCVIGLDREIAPVAFVPAWKIPPPGLSLAPGEVHVWCAALDPSPDHVERLFCLLSADERLRAARLVFDRDRKQFIIARGLLRTLLGRYLDLEPRRITFGYGAHGKPFLAGEFEHGGLEFNLSHSQEMTLYAFSYRRSVGIDVEYIRPRADIEALAARFFAPRERAMLSALPEAEKLIAFFNCWTSKEAYLKAQGVGLAQSLNQFEVSFVHGTPVCLSETSGNPGQAARWSLQSLTPAPGYSGAVAVAGQGWQLECWQYTDDRVAQSGGIENGTEIEIRTGA